MAFRGVDVSKYQPNIDWKKVKESGISFAIIRTGYSQTTDNKFVSHIQGALEAGINVGVYCYAKANNVTEAVEEADYVLGLIKPYRISYPVCYDVESTNLQALDNQKRTDIAIAFCERIQSAGYYAMIYTNKNWLENMLDYNRLKPYDIWLAQWATKPTWNGTYGMWQYGLDHVDGIGDCDCDVSYKDYPDIITKGGLNNLASNTLCIGSRIKYTGKVHTTSWGLGRSVDVNGIFTVRQIIKKRKYGVQIDQLGWIAEQDCNVI